MHGITKYVFHFILSETLWNPKVDHFFLNIDNNYNGIDFLASIQDDQVSNRPKTENECIDKDC